MPDIVLTTLNAKYIHASLGLRYLYENLGELRAEAEIFETTIHRPPEQIAESILEKKPRVVGFGIYIWNVCQSLAVIEILKSVAPKLVVVVGGPEVSHESEGQAIVALSDFCIQGEADHAFAELCQKILDGNPPEQKISKATSPDVSSLSLPYELFSDNDILNRVVYVEASRGCPYRCEFCLSSMENSVRNFDLDKLFAAFEALWAKGLRRFKFIDRTFNLSLSTASKILNFFLSRLEDGLFLHFEMVPDRLPAGLRTLIAQFPPGVLQFEIGVQTFHQETSRLISRRQNLEKLEDNLRWLRSETGVHLHVDLIAGLPAEGLQSFALGFDRLLAMGPQEIQVGILKRLRGAPISRHCDEFELVFSQTAPYEIIQTRDVSFLELQKIKRFARFFDLVSNRGQFNAAAQLLLTGFSPFFEFMDFSEWVYDAHGGTDRLNVDGLSRLIFRFWVERGKGPALMANALLNDAVLGKRKLPKSVAEYVDSTSRGDAQSPSELDQSGRRLPARQKRHLRVIS